ncbi:DUF7115 domain-containing protein [Natrialbaceae archaeon A-gly3]
MNVPAIVQSTLDGEELSTRVALGGEDELLITPSRTLIYRAEGLLSDESVEEFPHEADRLTLSEGRRKTRFTLEYALEGTRDFTIPAKRTEPVLHPVLAGILSGNDVTDPGETVLETYRFSELTVIITSDRLVKHIGEAVWDEDFEQYHYDEVTNLSFEPGSVSTQIVLEAGGRQQRIKAPNDSADDVRERLKRALFEYYGVSALEELNELLEPEDDEPEPISADLSSAFESDVDPLEANPPEPDDEDDVSDPSAGEDNGVADDDPLTAVGVSGDGSVESASGGQAATAIADTPEKSGDSFEQSGSERTASAPDPELLERIEALEATVARQNELLEQQGETIEQLIEELRRGR